MKDILPGFKTYLAAGIVALTSFAVAVGWLTQEQATATLGLAGALGLIGLHAQNERKTAEVKAEVKAAVRETRSPLV